MKTLPWISQGKFTSTNKKLILIDKSGNIYFFTGQDWTVRDLNNFAFYKCKRMEVNIKM